MKSFLQNVLFVIITFVFSNSGLAQNYNKYAVVLGEKTWNDSIEIKANNSIALAIRIDGEGNYYPNDFISDKSLKKSKGKLSNWFDENPKQF